MVAVLEKRGRFLVAEPLFGPGPRTAVERGGADDGRPRAGRLGQARRTRAAQARPAGSSPATCVEGLMLDRGLYRAYPRAASAEADAATERSVRRRRARRPARAAHLHDRPRRRQGLRRRDLGPARGRPRAALGPHRGRDRLPASRRAGSSARRFRRGTSVYVPGAVEPMLPEVLSNRGLLAAPGGGQARGDRRDGDARRRRDAVWRSTARCVRSDRRLTYGEVDELFAGRARAEEPWAEPLEVAREVARALRERRDVARVRLAGEPSLRLRLRRPPRRASATRQQTESHRVIEMLMILANEQVAGYLADQSCRPSTACTSAPSRSPSRS